MGKIKDIKELREFFLELEENYDLLNFEIDGVKPWQLERVKIDYALGKVSGVMNTPHTTTSVKDKILNIFSIFKSAIFINPFLSKKVDTIVFPHSRIKKIDDEYIDIYTHYFINKLIKEDENFIEIESPHLGKHYKDKKSWRYHNDLILIIVNLFSRFVKVDSIDLEFIDKVEREIEEKIGKYDLKSLLILTTKRYKVQYYLYYKLFKKLKPKQIYIVVSYGGSGAMIRAAKDLAIEVIEFQHGNFSKYHFGYYFGEDRKQVDYFPDKFFVWNKYWKTLISFPIDENKVIINGFDYLENKKKSYKHIKKEKDTMVILSQGVLGDLIATKILENWDYFQFFDIKYKLHPGEYNRWETYSSLLELSLKENIEVVQDIDLYSLFAQCEYQVGVFSTALSEGVEFGCKTILLNLSGIEGMSKFREVYNVIVV